MGQTNAERQAAFRARQKRKLEELEALRNEQPTPPLRNEAEQEALRNEAAKLDSLKAEKEALRNKAAQLRAENEALRNKVEPSTLRNGEHDG